MSHKRIYNHDKKYIKADSILEISAGIPKSKTESKSQPDMVKGAASLLIQV